MNQKLNQKDGKSNESNKISNERTTTRNNDDLKETNYTHSGKGDKTNPRTSAQRENQFTKKASNAISTRLQNENSKETKLKRIV